MPSKRCLPITYTQSMVYYGKMRNIRRKLPIFYVVSLVISIGAGLFFLRQFTDLFRQPSTTLSIAFVGDFGLTEDTKNVLQLIANESPDALIMLGDYDYIDTPSAFIALLNTYIPNVPLTGVIGNHDVKTWHEYEKFFESKRETQLPLQCTGEIGIEEVCTTPYVTFVNVGIGMTSQDPLTFIEKTLQESKTPWNFCVWHFNHTNLQVGKKTTEAPTEAYEVCRKYGAAVITAHEHSYSRTYALRDYTTLDVATTESHIELIPGTSFTVVSGLGGKSIREANPERVYLSHWASAYTASHSAKAGVFFCTLEEKHIQPKGNCYFKNVDGEIIDAFTLLSTLNQ